ncbi:MAG: phosphopantothenate synthase, partial [Candidatus Parcubacteria bacterium]|nr:phosphopantothenate synthase [Burkholderiales bacterium]
ISGPVALAAPEGVARVSVRSAQQMFDEVKAVVDDSDVFISVAAVADWKVGNASKQKIKKANGKAPLLKLQENPDILSWVAARKNAPFCVGFAAESEKLGENARAKRAKKGVPLIAANLAQQAIGADDNSITLFDARGSHALGSGPKIELARKLVGHIAGMLKKAKR